MRNLLIVAVFALATAGPAMAQSTCEAKAVGKAGKPLSGAAKNSFVKKCKADACEASAISKDGKKLTGAAKTSHMTKCEAGA